MNKPLSGIITHLIGGPLGVGKTSLLKHLMAQKPADERWAVLVNEFGQVGLDAALLSSGDDGIAIAEVAGGCVCCVNGAPFQVGLARLLRRARPQRLFIEASGLGHPLSMLQQLQAPPWRGVLQVQPLVMVVAGPGGAQPLPALLPAYHAAGLIVASHADAATAQDHDLAAQQWAGRALQWVAHGALPLAALPVVIAPVDNPPASVPLVLRGTPAAEAAAAIHVQEHDGHWSVGWRWPPATLLDLAALQACVRQWQWLRCKAVIHSPGGWFSANAQDGESWRWQPSEWRRDSRLELIFREQPDQQALLAAVAATLHSPG